MTKEELIRQAAKCLPSKVTTVKEEKAFIEGFVRGAEWMQERMQESNEGQALLYAVERSVVRTKREVVKKAVEWIRTNWREYINGPDKDGCIAFAHWENDFRKAMEE